MTPESGASLPQVRADYRRIWRVLPRRFRSGLLLLLAATLCGAALEVLALWLLGALMSVITPGAAHPSGPTAGLVEVLGGTGDGPAFRLIAITASAFLVKNLFMAGVAWAEATFAFTLQSHLADRVLRGILVQDYVAAATRPASEYLNLLTHDLHLIIQQFVLPTLTVASETLLLLSVVGFLLWLEPGLTGAVIVCVGGAAWLLVHWSRRVMGTIAQRRQRLEDERLRKLRELFGHLREVYVYRAGTQAREWLQSGLGEIARVYRLFQLMTTGPRFALEVVLVSVLLAAIVVGLRNQERQALIVSVGVFAASGFRLLIGANRLIMSMQGIRFSRPAILRMLDVLARGDALPDPLPTEAPKLQDTAHTLTLREVQYRYPGAASPVLAAVDLTLSRGTLVGIRGGSGTGKTTLLEVLGGLRSPTGGEILADARPLRSAGEFFHLVGYVGQSPAVFSDSIRGNVAFGTAASEVDDERVWRALEGARLATLVRSLPHGLDARLGEGAGFSLSGGQAQRLSLARALYANCQFLLLDEPTSALDLATEEEVVATLEAIARDRAVLVVSHRPRPLQSCDVLYELRDGRLCRVAVGVRGS
jgi:ATP-binding cassette, subfamily B, bacterial PglK